MTVVHGYRDRETGWFEADSMSSLPDGVPGVAPLMESTPIWDSVVRDFERVRAEEAAAARAAVAAHRPASVSASLLADGAVTAQRVLVREVPFWAAAAVLAFVVAVLAGLWAVASLSPGAGAGLLFVLLFLVVFVPLGVWAWRAHRVERSQSLEFSRRRHPAGRSRGQGV